ncbi:TIGR03086 family metal-binding protein [Amycolatopsis roodepoortensis]|uniref:TIGR03086 family metal-binding protein n=1 Tax=Amycolatopsis roodepoortensis TaxID=700274 RepID=UPI00214C2CE9|nr:TIGR03086 family metal-binding protein [Amycolatopsis roodepoortensis]UUV27636.1 TIGR03086 family metal-binding protein [Amycolatopsis roodepoortensis]
MSEHAALIAPAAAEFAGILRGIGESDLSARTPCAEYDVRALLNHLLYWGPWLEAAGRKAPPPEVSSGEAEADLVGGGWLADIEKQTARLVDVFGTPEAWQGQTTFGGNPMPASMAGYMVLDEFVFHGWDLARATGSKFSVLPEVADAVYAIALEIGDQARAMKVYGEEVAVADGATTFERALGATGRDPGWTP